MSDASFEAVGGFRVGRKVIWIFDLPIELTAELKGNADRRETCPIDDLPVRVIGHGRDHVGHA